MALAAAIAARCMGEVLARGGSAHANNYLSILMSCHVTCGTRPSASLCVLNEAGRSGTRLCCVSVVSVDYVVCAESF